MSQKETPDYVVTVWPDQRKDAVHVCVREGFITVSAPYNDPACFEPDVADAVKVAIDEAVAWLSAHPESVAPRLAREQDRRDIERRKQEARSKLTDEEQRLLGLRSQF